MNLRWINRFHMVIHLLMGIGIAFAWIKIKPQMGINTVLGLSILANFLPDIDHVFYIWGYGRNSEYARSVRNSFRIGGSFKMLEFCAQNHKKLTGLYSHTIYTTIACLVLATISFNQNTQVSLFAFGMFAHFVFDMAEDILLLGKLNKNWYGNIG